MSLFRDCFAKNYFNILHLLFSAGNNKKTPHMHFYSAIKIKIRTMIVQYSLSLSKTNRHGQII